MAKRYKVLVIVDTVFVIFLAIVAFYYGTADAIDFRFWLTLVIMGYAAFLLRKNYRNYQEALKKEGNN